MKRHKTIQKILGKMGKQRFQMLYERMSSILETRDLIEEEFPELKNSWEETTEKLYNFAQKIFNEQERRENELPQFKQKKITRREAHKLLKSFGKRRTLEFRNSNTFFTYIFPAGTKNWNNFTVKILHGRNRKFGKLSYWQWLGIGFLLVGYDVKTPCFSKILNEEEKGFRI